MQFDTPTTLIAIATVVAVLGVQVLFFWTQDRRSPWLAAFAVTFLLGAAGALLYLLPTTGMEFAVYGGGNALRIAAFGFLWHAARLFSGRRAEPLAIVLAVAVWLALSSIPAFLDSLVWRIVGASAFTSLFCALAGWELWRSRDEMLPSRLPATAVCLSFAILVALRIPLVDVLPFPMGALPLSDAWLAAFGLIVFVHASFLAAFALAMTRERRELEQRQFALLDPLTGLLNRRAFLDHAARVERRRKSARDPFAVLVLDLDDFKSVNDRYGHEAGDLVLQHFAAIARGATRAGDLLFRMGGEEFCFVLQAAGTGEARIVAERIRTSFAETHINVGGQSITETVSIGIAATEHPGFDLEVLLAAADAAVYEAKARGRNISVDADAAALLRPLAVSRAAA